MSRPKKTTFFITECQSVDCRQEKTLHSKIAAEEWAKAHKVRHVRGGSEFESLSVKISRVRGSRILALPTSELRVS